MYKILIADDEGIVRESLKFIIDKDFSDCEIYLAKSGRQAIELAEEHRPDIALLDIQMPGINGLSALREIKTIHPHIRALILTAFDNFDYAKEALELGAADYIMKPIDRKKITEELTRIMHEIDAERRKRQDDLSIREKMEAVVPIIEHGFVLSLIIQNEYGYSGMQYRSLLNLNEEYGFIAVFEWGEGFEKEAPGNPIGASVRAQKFATQMSRQIRIFFKAYLSDIMGNKLIAAIPWNDSEMSYSDRLRMIERMRSLVTSLKEMVGIDFKAGIGSVQPWSDMFDSYQEALNALRHGVRKVTHIDDLLVRNDAARQQASLRRTMLEAIRSGEEAQVLREAEMLLAWYMDERNSTRNDAQMALLEILLEGRRIVTEQGKDPGTHAGKELMQATRSEDIRQIFMNGVLQLAREIAAQDTKQDGVIQVAQEYIRKHFTSDLSLEMAAQQVNISPYYFSKLFKEETGINFSDYLTNLRIQKARELLRQDPDRNIKEISIEAGYSNPNYFSRIFKKCTGMTPTELRDALKSGRGDGEALYEEGKKTERSST